MFLFNWFRYSNNKTPTITPNETYTIKKETFDTLLNRIRDLTDKVEELKKQTEQPLKINNINLPSLSSTPEPILCTPIKKSYPIPPFQEELEKKLAKLREKMGTSHGWGDVPLNNLDDLENLEKSVMEQSMIFNVGKQIERTNCPINSNL
jgi:hypothetical protein